MLYTVLTVCIVYLYDPGSRIRGEVRSPESFEAPLSSVLKMIDNICSEVQPQICLQCTYLRIFLLLD